jgi:hypothetical protein
MRCCGLGSTGGMWQSAVPCESPQRRRGAAARSDSALRCPAGGILAWVKDEDLPREAQRGGAGQFGKEACTPGGATPVLMRCRRILRHCWGSVMTASTFMGEPQRLQ